MAKVNELGTNLVYCGYVGGSHDEAGRGIALDSSGNAYTTGETGSTESTFPVTAGSFDGTHGGSDDAFVVKIIDTVPTAVTLADFSAQADRRGVLLHWNTAAESDHLGFHLWASRDGLSVRLTSQLLAGSALLAPAHTPVPGAGYSFWDTQGNAQAYWLEAVDLQGRSQFLGPAFPRPARAPLPPPDQEAAYLATLGQARDPEPAGAPLRRWAASASGPHLQRAGAPAPRDLAARPGVQLAVRDDGWYRVTGAQLLAAGLPPDTDARRLHLYAGGREVALCRSGSGSRLAPTDTLEFYGIGLETPWADTRPYWLAADPRTPGTDLRLAPTPRARGTAPPAFPETVERRDRTLYFPALRNGEASNLFGPLLSPGASVAQPLEVVGVGPSPDESCLLEVQVQGVSDPPGSGDHRVQVTLNGTLVGEVRCEGQEAGVAAFRVPQTLVREGANAVQLAAAAGPADVTLVDTVRLSYWRRYAATGPQFRCLTPAGSPFRLTGFGTDPVEVLDVTQAEAPLRLTTRERSGGVEGVAPAGTGSRLLVAVRRGSGLAPVRLTRQTPSRLAEAGQGAELVLLGPAAFLEATAPLAARRRAQGLRVAPVALEDVQDEFAFGEAGPAGVRAFLAHARRVWRPAPRWVALIGDTSVDPRGELGLGRFDFVPSVAVATARLETQSDDALADGDGDGVPEMAVGRLPGRSAGEIGQLVAKVLAREAEASGAGWRSESLLVADRSAGYDFVGAASAVGKRLPPGLRTTLLARDRGADADAVRSALTGGVRALTYVGHSSVGAWAGGTLTSGSARQLGNGGRQPVALLLTCLNGYHGICSKRRWGRRCCWRREGARRRASRRAG